VIVGVHGQDRRYIHTFGANAALRVHDLDELFAADALYVGGYLLLPGLSAGELAERLRLARARGVLTVLDVAIPAEDASRSPVDVAELLPHVDVFVPNEDEARVLTGQADPHRQARLLAEAGAKIVIVTRGAAGAVVCHQGNSFDVAAPDVEVVDESGAGDAFDAGLILGLLEGWDIGRSAAFASIVGASSCASLGCWESVCTRSEAEALLEKQASA